MLFVPVKIASQMLRLLAERQELQVDFGAAPGKESTWGVAVEGSQADSSESEPLANLGNSFAARAVVCRNRFDDPS